MTDPFGRSATFEYDACGRLVRITDVIGLQSEFEYDSTDFVKELRTPYGRTRFTQAGSGMDRWIEAEDALGGVERVETQRVASMPTSDPVAPAGYSENSGLHYRNTFYWSKRAYGEGAEADLATATVYHWLHSRYSNGGLTAGTLESEKKPLENRVWYTYAGPGVGLHYESGTMQPASVARVLDDGSTQVNRYEYNALGRTTRSIDPMGREIVSVYGNGNVPDTNPATGEGLDLLQVKRKNGSSYDLLASYTYNDEHQPLTITDAGGGVTTYTYNAAGQVLTVTTPPAQGHSQGATTSFSYDPDGRLLQVSGPVPGASSSFTYDAYGRRRTSTDATGLTLTYDYDALDRVTRVTYPDATYEETVYKWLDAEKRRDRLGRWTQTFYDALRRPVAVRDAAGGHDAVPVRRLGLRAVPGAVTGISRLTDANGNATSWGYDLQGRVTSETRADGSSESYSYEASTSRLATEDRPQEHHHQLRVLPRRQAEAQELLGHHAAGELHLRPRRRADAHRRERHRHPDLELRRARPGGDRGQRQERLDRGLHVRRGRQPHHALPGRGDPRQLRLRPAEPADQHHAGRERVRLRLRHRVASHLDDLPQRRGDGLRLRRRVAPHLTRRQPQRHADHQLQLHPRRRGQPDAEDHPRLGGGLRLRRAVPAGLGGALGGHADPLAICLRPGREPDRRADGRRLRWGPASTA